MQVRHTLSAIFSFALLGALLIALPSPAGAQGLDPRDEFTTVGADLPGTPAAIGGLAPSDELLAEQVLSAINSDPALAGNASEITVIAQSGVVTLRGTTDSDEESNDLVEAAREVAGGANVINHLISRDRASDLVARPSSGE